MKSEDIHVGITMRETGCHEAVCNITAECEALVNFVLSTFGEEEGRISDRYNALSLLKRNLDLIDAIGLHMEEREWKLEEPDKALQNRIETLEFELKCLRRDGLQ